MHITVILLGQKCRETYDKLDTYLEILNEAMAQINLFRSNTHTQHDIYPGNI